MPSLSHPLMENPQRSADSSPEHASNGLAKAVYAIPRVLIALGFSLLGVAGGAVLMAAIAPHLSGMRAAQQSAVVSVSLVVGVVLLFWLLRSASSVREVLARFRTVLLVEAAFFALVTAAEGVARLVELFV